jgi:phosphoribosylaminoimidazole-succinocarboxamide synthase
MLWSPFSTPNREGRREVTREKRELMYEGSAKRLYQTDKSEFIIQEFHDGPFLPDGKKSATFKNKGALNNKISSFLFEYLEGYHIPTHFVEQLSESEMLVKRLDILPFEVVVRNMAAGNFSTQYGIKEGVDLPHPVIEHYLKSNRALRPLMNEYHIFAIGLATPEELKLVNRVATKVNVVLRSFFERRGIRLVDCTLEFGRHNGQILLGDEVSPDTCRLWDTKTQKKLNGERVREDPAALEAVYEEIRNRVFMKIA